MKNFIVLSLLTVYFLVLPPLVQAQYYTRVLEVYYRSIANPESFDQFVANNQSLFDGGFFSCLNSLEQFWQSGAKQEISVCDRLLNPEWRSKCISEYHFVPFITWSLSLRAVLTGQHKWADTISGRRASDGKHLSEIMLPGGWVFAIDQSMPLLRAYLLCQ